MKNTSALNKILLAASDSTYTSKVEVDIEHHELVKSEFVQVESIDAHDLHLKWETEIEAREWGIKSMSANILTKEVEVSYEVEDWTGVDPEAANARPKIIEGSIMLSFAGIDIDIEYHAEDPDRTGIIFYPDHATFTLEGEALDPKSWKISQGTIQFRI